MSSRKDGIKVDSKGYLTITAGPLRGVRVHRLVAAAKLGRPLKKDEDVHHKDGDRTNNSPDNLELFASKHLPGVRESDEIASLRRENDVLRRKIADLQEQLQTL